MVKVWNSIFYETRLISVIGITLLLYLRASGAGVDCKKPEKVNHMAEDDPPGSLIFSVPGSDDLTWSFSIPQFPFLESYFKFAVNFQVSPNTTNIEVKRQFVTTKALDLESMDTEKSSRFSGIVFVQLTCETKLRKLRYVVFFGIKEVNEFDPKFTHSLIQKPLKENACVDMAIIRLKDWAEDKDKNFHTSEIYMFKIEELPYAPGDHKYFYMSNPVNGEIRLALSPDYETLPSPTLSVQVTVLDQGHRKGTGVLQVTVENVNDSPPHFYHPICGDPCHAMYSTSISLNFMGPLMDLFPAPIMAFDTDSDDSGASEITYEIIGAPAGYGDYSTFFKIDPSSGVLILEAPLKDIINGSIKLVSLLVKATEGGKLNLSAVTTVIIAVGAGETNSDLYPSSYTRDSAGHLHGDQSTHRLQAAILAAWSLLFLQQYRLLHA